MERRRPKKRGQVEKHIQLKMEDVTNKTKWRNAVKKVSRNIGTAELDLFVKINPSFQCHRVQSLSKSKNKCELKYLAFD